MDENMKYLEKSCSKSTFDKVFEILERNKIPENCNNSPE